MALHTGAAEERDGDYFGPPVNRVARLLSAGHGGQTLLSGTTRGLVVGSLPQGTELRGLGEATSNGNAPESLSGVSAKTSPPRPPVTGEGHPSKRPLDPSYLRGQHDPGNGPGQNVEDPDRAQHHHDAKGSRQGGGKSHPHEHQQGLGRLVGPEDRPR